MTFDLYVWKSPSDLDADRAETLLEAWRASGADPGASPFEPSTDVGWFFRELIKDAPDLDASSDAAPTESRKPIWMAAGDEPPARLVRMRVSPATSPAALDAILGLAAKYDLVLFDTRSRRVHRPLAELAAQASATFWPAGALQAGVAGAVGGVIAVGAWLLGIPLLSGFVAVVGGFMFVMALVTFAHEGRARLRARRSGGTAPPSRKGP